MNNSFPVRRGAEGGASALTQMLGMEIAMGETCDMVILEDGDMKHWWECSECKTHHKATAKFERSKTCPACGKEIANWIGMDDEYDA